MMDGSFLFIIMKLFTAIVAGWHSTIPERMKIPFDSLVCEMAYGNM